MTLQSSSSHRDHCPLGALDLFKLWRADPHLETVVPFQGTNTRGSVRAQFLAPISQDFTSGSAINSCVTYFSFLIYKKKYNTCSFSHLGPCEGLLGTGLLKRQICLEGCGPRPSLLAINGVYGTKGNTLLS